MRHLGVKPGEHKVEVLASLGYTKDDIDRLREKGVEASPIP